MSLIVAAHAQAAGITSADWTAIGTLALAAVTVVLVAVTIWVTVGDRHRERDRAGAERFREQEAEAHLVQVDQAAIDATQPVFKEGSPTYPPDRKRLQNIAALVVNRSDYTITHIDVRFCARTNDGPRVQPFGGGRVLVPGRNSSSDLLPSTAWQSGQPWITSPDRLAPWDTGLRVETGDIAADIAQTAYPIVRWTDWRGTQWEHKRGVIRKVKPGEPWTP